MISPRWQAKLKNWHTRYLPKGSIRSSIVSGGFWSLTGSVLSKICGLLGSIIFARLLGKTNFGKWLLICVTRNLVKLWRSGKACWNEQKVVFW